MLLNGWIGGLYYLNMFKKLGLLKIYTVQSMAKAEKSFEKSNFGLIASTQMFDQSHRNFEKIG